MMATTTTPAGTVFLDRSMPVYITPIDPLEGPWGNRQPLVGPRLKKDGSTAEGTQAYAWASRRSVQSCNWSWVWA